jgi:L-fuculose-phosphate aldolase
MDERAGREALVGAARRLDAAGLNTNTSGNLSIRVAGGLLITPSGIPPSAMAPADIVRLHADGAPDDPAGPVPTSEWRLHVELLRRRPEVGAVVHTHSPEATAAATLGRPVPAVHYVVARFGGPTLPCAPYATYGSAQLATHVADTVGDDRMASLMANHGAITLGTDLEHAVSLALDVEWFCGVHRRARQLGDPVTLSDGEVGRVADRLTRYGQPPQPS